MFNFAASNEAYLIMKKEKILEAAEELFAEKGYEGTSVRDIAQKADVNIAMISYYFGSKEKLLEALIEENSEYTTGILKEISTSKTLDPWQKLDSMVDHYVDRIIGKYKYHNIMSRQISLIQDKHLQEKMVAIKMKNRGVVHDLILNGQKAGLFRKVDVELTLASMIGTISQATMSRAFYTKALELKEDISEEEYFLKIKHRLKKHLKSMLRAHLDIKNDQ